MVDALTEQDAVVERLKQSFTNPNVVDRRQRPSHGYRAVHVIVAVQDKPVEIQVRTLLQHFWAQVSERYADALGPAIKYGGGPDRVRATMLAESEAMAFIELSNLQQPPSDDMIGEKVRVMRRMLQLWTDAGGDG